MITSNSISISWKSNPDAISYQVGIVNSFGNLVSFDFPFSSFLFFCFIKFQSTIKKISNEIINSTRTSYTFTNLTSNTLYKMRLFTQVSSSSSTYFRDVTSTTYPSRTSFFFFFLFSFFRKYS